MKFALICSLVALTSAAPVDTTPKVSLASDLPFFYPEAKFEVNPPSSSLGPGKDDADTGLKYLLTKHSLKETDLQVTSSYVDNAGVTHTYGVHLVNGRPVTNHRCAVHVQKGKIMSWSSSFVDRSSTIKVPLKSITEQDAIASAETKTGVPRLADIPVALEYVSRENGQLVQAYTFQLKSTQGSEWMQVYVDSSNGDIIHAVDFVNYASYKVVARPSISPLDGFTDVKDPAYLPSSRLGWHDDGKTKYTTAKGNNAAVTLPDGSTVSSTGDLVFTHKWDASQEAKAPENQKAATINLFYLSNLVHDITYQYGFTEAAGNFQTNNFESKSGKGGDAVAVSAQSSQGTNNAYMQTPPDGQSPSLVMFLFTSTKPQRDGALENDIPIHEYGHGISNRMTGGSGSASCLRNRESGGMGEGWSDTLAMYLLRKANDTRETPFVLGDYVINKPTGIRSYPYTTDMKKNPLTYTDLKSRSEVHQAGEIWATILNEMYWNLVDKYGYSENWFDAKQTQGNIVALQLMIGGFANQPCNPTFLQARDAILVADKIYYQEKNKCLVWKAFAKRGMGVGAKNKTNDFTLPTECQ